jgi:hypothetical protein
MASGSSTTLYLRGVPRAVVREAKAAAAREGVTLAQWVTTRIASGTDPSVPEGVSADPLRDDLAFYDEQRVAFEQKYPGEYIAIVNRRVVDHDARFDALARRVFQKYGARPVCMPLVGRTTVRVRSPRRAAG